MPGMARSSTTLEHRLFAGWRPAFLALCVTLVHCSDAAPEPSPDSTEPFPSSSTLGASSTSSLASNTSATSAPATTSTGVATPPPAVSATSSQDSSSSTTTSNSASDSGDSTEPNDGASSVDFSDVTSASTAETSSESPVTPPPDLPSGVTNMFPLPDARDLCPDPSLHLHFDAPPRLGSSGRVSVYDAANPGSPVAVVDMSRATVSDTVGGSMFTLNRGAYVDGNEVIFTLPARGLGYGKTFYVHIDQGVVTDGSGKPFTINNNNTWRFTTRAAAPSDVSLLRVSLDGEGEFCTVQGAIDAARDKTTISIGAGNYYGIVYFKNKNGLTLRGDDRAKTAIKGINNNDLNPSTRGRALFGTENVSELTLRNLTVHNLTPQGGSQAEALALLSCDKCVVRDANILSLQDTLLWSGRIYADNCYIAGNVDYIWGTGTVYFNECEIRTVGRKGYNVQARNGANTRGYVFVDSKLTSEPGITGDVLARIDVSAYPHSEVAYIDCEMGDHISPAGWQITGGNAPQTLKFVEYGSRSPNGTPIDTRQRLAGSRQLNSNDAAKYRDPAQVLGGWLPPTR
jgi:pectin methylesterase-like acyl-CoA thioesterase